MDLSARVMELNLNAYAARDVWGLVSEVQYQADYAAMSLFTFCDVDATFDDLDERWAIAQPCDGNLCEGDCTWHLKWSTEFNDIGPDTPGAFPITVLEA